MAKVKSKSKVKPASLSEVLQVLRMGQEATVNAKVFYGLSDLSEADLEQLQTVWLEMDTEYREKIVKRIADIGETNFDLDYRAFGLFALRDEDEDVREVAISILWLDESLSYMRILMDIAQNDESTTVRAAATGELGRFILLGELGDLPEREIIPVQELVVSFWSDDGEEVEVRRRALEAISNSNHEIITEAIEEAYKSDERLLRVSAVFAMGRSCDAQWEEIVLKELSSPDAELRFEAARAAGELMLTDATPPLARLVRSNDREIQEAAIWSLGEIGGAGALRILNALASEVKELDDAELLEVVEDAIGSASIAGGDLPFPRDIRNN